MDRFSMEIESLQDVEILMEKKNRIKDSVVDPELNWLSRMELYEQVQLINVRIQKLVGQGMHC